MKLFNSKNSTDSAYTGPLGVFRRGAEDGMWFGLYLSAIIIFAALSVWAWLMGWLSILLMLMVPIVVYKALRRSFIACGERPGMSEIWMQGICMFFFGSLLMALVVYIGLRWIDPTFISSRLAEAADLYRQIDLPEATDMADSLDLMIEKHMIPSSITIAFSLLWSSVFSGSILSLIIAFIIRLSCARRINDSNTEQ